MVKSAVKRSFSPRDGNDLPVVRATSLIGQRRYLSSLAVAMSPANSDYNCQELLLVADVGRTSLISLCNFQL